MSKEDEYHSSGADGSPKPQKKLKRDRAYFESQHSLSSGYNEQAEHLRSCEFKRLGSRVYVDHAGATLYSEKQLEHAYKVQHLLSLVPQPHLALLPQANVSQMKGYQKTLDMPDSASWPLCTVLDVCFLRRQDFLKSTLR